MRKKYFTQKNLFLAAYLIFLLMDIFVVRRLSDFIFLILTLLWLTCVFVLKLNRFYSMTLATICFLLAFATRFFNNFMIVEKAISWFAIFFSIALIQSFFMQTENANNR